MQSASLVGVEGMNALAVLFFALPAVLFLGRHRKRGMFLLLLLAAAHAGFGYYRLQDAAPANRRTECWCASSSRRSASRRNGTTRRATGFSPSFWICPPPNRPNGKSGRTLSSGPKPPSPSCSTDRPDAYSAIAAALEDGQTLLAGAVRQEGDRKSGEEVRYYNSLLVINDKGELVSASDKQHLVPFGEYLPLDGILPLAGPERSGQHARRLFGGRPPRATSRLPTAETQSADLLRSHLSRARSSTQDGRADAMVNVTNDAWYGNTPGPWQHLRFAQIRAVEQGLPLLRAANNGMSAAIDSYGQIVEGLNLNEIATIDTYLPGKASTNTVCFAGTADLFAHSICACRDCRFDYFARPVQNIERRWVLKLAEA